VFSIAEKNENEKRLFIDFANPIPPQDFPSSHHNFLSCATGLPDGKFSYQKSQFGSISEGLGIKILIYFLWYILWPFGNLEVILEYVSPFWYIVQRRFWQPWCAIVGNLIKICENVEDRKR
jgi:hypothetical protein